MEPSPTTSQVSLPTSTQSAPSPRITVEGCNGDSPLGGQRPPLTSTLSNPVALASFPSPMRQHKRTPSSHRQVKETLNARVEFKSDEADGSSYHRVNQYIIMEEIGRGSYGAVHLAKDQFGNEYAVKEFSKSRLRKRVQSQILRQGPHGPRRAIGRVRTGGRPLNPQLSAERPGEKADSLYLIREEVAIMKKLHHPNLVELIEVLDDPEEDSLYMVMEMCKNGVIMKVGLEETATPYDAETCRHFFRDLILAIEYLHAQGVIHCDIKPDNLLLSEDQILKVVDFGVSEMFDKPEGMRIAKSAGSPAFMPPELCGKHTEVSGQAADIWSMGISLYCLKYGKIPFNKHGVLEMYDAVKMENPAIPSDEDPDFVDLIDKILHKDPELRIKICELREHPWVTKNGTDPLLSEDENCAHLIDPPNELDISRAFTRKMDHLFCVMKAIHRFKQLLPARRSGSTTPTTQVRSSQATDETYSAENRRQPTEERARAQEIVAELVHQRDLLKEGDEDGKTDIKSVGDSEPLILGIGTGARDAFAMDEATPDVVAHSPTAVDFNIYDRAYEQAINEQLRSNHSHTRPVMYLTKLVKETDYFKKLENIVEGTKTSSDNFRETLRDTKEQLHDRWSATPKPQLTHFVEKFGLSNAGKKSTEAEAASTDSRSLRSLVEGLRIKDKQHSEEGGKESAF